MFGLNYDYKEFVRNLVLRLAKDTTGHILLIPHTFGPAGNVNNDADASRDIIMHLESPYRTRVHIVNGEYDQFAIKGIIGFCDFFIGSRMHACIAALSQGIPTVGVAYSRKFMGVFESIGAGNMVADARKLTGDEIISKIMSDYAQRTDLKVKLHHIDNAKNQLQDTFQILLRA
jgi:polysaccharide pyruvyl transferase WcaK-like protein